VILELGLLIGAVGRERTFIVRPKGVDMKMPSDLLEIKPVTYPIDPAIDPTDAVGPACDRITFMLGVAGPSSQSATNMIAIGTSST
jgi:predicted nucleotide-binding protein